jgi:MFS family permease
VLIDELNWQWIFFINVPIGIIAFGLGVWLMPVLPTNRHRFDVIGVVLSGAALFLIVFALQEGSVPRPLVVDLGDVRRRLGHDRGVRVLAVRQQG